MIDLFWAVATSYLVLGLVGAVFTAAAIVGYFPLLKWFPIIGEYVPVGKLVTLLMASLFCFLLGVRVTNEREAAKNLRSENATLKADIQTTKDAAEYYSMQYRDDEKQLQELEAKITAIPKNDGPCFDSDTASWLRSIR